MSNSNAWEIVDCYKGYIQSQKIHRFTEKSSTNYFNDATCDLLYNDMHVSIFIEINSEFESTTTKLNKFHWVATDYSHHDRYIKDPNKTEGSG